MGVNFIHPDRDRYVSDDDIDSLDLMYIIDDMDEENFNNALVEMNSVDHLSRSDDEEDFGAELLTDEEDIRVDDVDDDDDDEYNPEDDFLSDAESEDSFVIRVPRPTIPAAANDTTSTTAATIADSDSNSNPSLPACDPDPDPASEPDPEPA